MSVPNPLLVPPQRAALAGTALCTNEWYLFFRRTLEYMQQTGVDPSVIADMEARIAALEAAGASDFLLQGLLSVEVAGLPSNGLVQLSLVADEAAPAKTHYYGTSPSGPKGYHPIADAFEADSGELTKAVDPDGVTSFGLADVADTGTGALQKTQFDAKGRKTGTAAATTDDLAEGVTNLYFTNERAQDAVGSILTNTADITFTYNDPANTITASLAGALGAGGTSGQFWRGDKTWSNTLTGAFVAAGLTSLAAPLLIGGIINSTSGLSVGGTLTDSSTGTINSLSVLQNLQPAGATLSSLRSATVFTMLNGGASAITEYIGLFARTDITGGFTGTVTNLLGNVVGAPSTAVAPSNFTAYQAPNYTGATTAARAYRSLMSAAASRWNAFFDGTAQNYFEGSVGIGVSVPSAGKLVVAGNYAPSTDNAFSSGTATNRHSVVYAGTGTINTSDEREKEPVQPFTAGELAASVQMAREIGTYRWLESVEAKGDDARTHIGLTVQRAIEIMEAHGLDPLNYGFICYDSWDAHPEVWREIDEVRDDEGNLIQEAGRVLEQPARAAGDRYSFRHDQLLLFIARGQAERLDRLEALLNP